MESIDNSYPIPEPILTNVKEFLENHLHNDPAYLLAAQYGYNIAQIFVEFLKKEAADIINRYDQIIVDKETEIRKIKEQLEQALAELGVKIDRN